MNKITEIFERIISRFQKMNKKILRLFFIIILLFIVVITFIVGCVNKKRSLECKDLYNNISVYVEEYLRVNNLYPTLQGDSVTVELSNLEPIYFKKKQVTGSVKYTKYNDTYIKTYYVENCKYCSAKEFKKTAKEYNENKNMDVIVTYNYHDVSYYNSYWTNFIEPEKISSEETLGVNLPTDLKLLPKIPADAEVIEYIKEDKPYYSYRDIMYKWYKYNVAYSGFSSEQPNGYYNKDESTKITTDPTPYSLNYPEKKDYRYIKSATGYKWYYEENKNKIYWNGGEYSVEQPDPKYNKKDKQTATMYSYTDDMWKWYNGTLKRGYSSYVKTPSVGYIYKDNELYKYTNWSSYTDKSNLTSDTLSYREEVSKIYSRYMIKYRILSMAKLNNSVSREEFEKTTGRSLEELLNDENIYVEVNYEFKY